MGKVIWRQYVGLAWTETGSREVSWGPKKRSESSSRMANSGHGKEGLSVRENAESILQPLATDGVKREGRREKICGWVMGSH